MSSELFFLYPALLFPAIPLSMIAFGSRYTSLSILIRELHAQMINRQKEHVEVDNSVQIMILTKRLLLLKGMQTFAGLAFIFNLSTIFFGYLGMEYVATRVFGLSVLLFSISIMLYIIEIQQSFLALSTHIGDLENQEENKSFISKDNES